MESEFKSFSDVMGRSSNCRSANRHLKRDPGSVLLAISGHGVSKDKHERLAMTITIGEKVCRMARLVIGDRVDIRLDLKSRLMLLRRVKDGGYALSVVGTVAKKFEAEGRYMDAITKATIYPGRGVAYKKIGRSVCDHTVTDDGILIDIPAAFLE